MLKISYSGCFGLFPAILAQFTLELLSQPKIVKNLLKPAILGARSFKVIDVNIFKKLVASACYDKQHVCAYLQPFFTLDELIKVK